VSHTRQRASGGRHRTNDTTDGEAVEWLPSNPAVRSARSVRTPAHMRARLVAWCGACLPACCQRRVAGMHRMRPLGSRTRTRDNGRDQSRPVLCCRVSRGGQRNPGGARGQRRFNAAPVRAKRPVPFPPSEWLGWQADKRETLASPVLLRQALVCANGRTSSVSKSSGPFNLNLLYYYWLGSTSANILITCPIQDDPQPTSSPEAGNHESLYLKLTYRKFNPDGAKKGGRRGTVQLCICAW
jgi:hypothetical protein